VEKYFTTLVKVKTSTLEAFVEPEELSFESLLRSFIDGDRLKRAQRIKDNELTIQQETDNQIKALIREYHIVIDLQNRVILHDCADWSKALPSKRFCKHLGKLLLSIDKEKASNILKQIYANKKAWEFKPYTA